MKAPQTERNGRNYRPIHQFNDFIESLLEPQKRRAPNTFRIRALPASQSCRCLCRLPVSQGVELHLLFAPATPDIPQKGQALNPGPRKNQIKPNERVKCRWLAGKEAEINPIETQVLPQCSMKCSVRRGKTLRAANKNPLPYNLSAHACALTLMGAEFESRLGSDGIEWVWAGTQALMRNAMPDADVWFPMPIAERWLRHERDLFVNTHY